MIEIPSECIPSISGKVATIIFIWTNQTVLLPTIVTYTLKDGILVDSDSEQILTDQITNYTKRLWATMDKCNYSIGNDSAKLKSVTLEMKYCHLYVLLTQCLLLFDLQIVSSNTVEFLVKNYSTNVNVSKPIDVENIAFVLWMDQMLFVGYQQTVFNASIKEYHLIINTLASVC